MRTDQIELAVTVRSEVGKIACRRLRHQGKVPAVVYGRDADPLPVAVDEATFSRLLPESGWYSTLLKLQIEGASGDEASPMVMIKEVQQHLVPRKIISIDFRRTSMQEKIQTTVPVLLVGESPGVKLGGILEHLLHEMPVECLPGDIPDHLEADISGLEIAQSIRVRDVAAPADVTISASEDDVVALVAAPVTVEEEPAEAPEDEGAVVEETAEPELIGESEREQAGE